MNIFCCHSSMDKDIVKPIAMSLKNKDYAVFLDEWSLVPGDSLVEKLPEAIAKSGVFILFLSKASNDSAWCKKELAIAISQMLKSNRIRVFAYRLEQVDPPLILDDTVYIDAVTLGYEQSLVRLFAAAAGEPLSPSAEAYKDIVVEHLDVPLESPTPLPGTFHAIVRISAKRFSHPRLYVRLTASAPISTQIHQSVEGFDGMRTMTASAVHGHVLEHTQGPPGLEPAFPWILVVFADQPVAIQDIEIREENPFKEVAERASRAQLA